MSSSPFAHLVRVMTFALAVIATTPASAQGLVATHRISAAVASELVAAAVTACKQKNYDVTAVVLDIDGVRQALLRGDGAGIATLEVAYDKAFTSISTRSDTGALADRFKRSCGRCAAEISVGRIYSNAVSRVTKMSLWHQCGFIDSTRATLLWQRREPSDKSTTRR